MKNKIDLPSDQLSLLSSFGILTIGLFGLSSVRSDKVLLRPPEQQTELTFETVCVSRMAHTSAGLHAHVQPAGIYCSPMLLIPLPNLSIVLPMLKVRKLRVMFVYPYG